MIPHPSPSPTDPSRRGAAFGAKIMLGLGLVLLVSTPLASAHVGEHPSLHDTVAGVARRLQDQFSEEELKALDAYQVESILTPEEKEILGREHISFTVNVPVVVSILRDRSLKSEPFWIRERGFQLTGLVFNIGKVEVDVWQRAFDAGRIGLGMNGFANGQHYVVTLAPQNAGDRIQVSGLYPGELRVGEFVKDAKPYVDTDDKLPEVPEALRGQTLVRTESESADDSRLVKYFRWTEHPATASPDQIVLTWTGDPKTTQTIQWRTSREIPNGKVAYQKKALVNRFQAEPLATADASTRLLHTPSIINDPAVHLHTAHLVNLEAGTTYVYSVGSGIDDDWTELAEFTTAPAETEPFSFIYMGDAQNGLYRWSSLVKRAFLERPDAAFYIMAGDLVDRGNDRDDWDAFFHAAEGVYDRRQLVPSIGNHENQGGHPTLYLELMNLLENGPDDVEKERAYSFHYSNAHFIVLDSNLKPETQTTWLEKTLAESKATWKFAIYHHPAYSSAPSRDNADIRKLWGDLFDKYHVDIALQGHDHAYLRTFPMKDGKKVGSAKEGTIYIVSVSGTKMYDQDKRDYTEFGMTNTATYQTLDIQISGDRLAYRAYDIDGKLRDEFVIEK